MKATISNSQAIKEGLRDHWERQALRKERAQRAALQSTDPSRATKRWAREKAERLGLQYWPALAFGPRIDPAAYLAAERELERTHGRWGEIQVDGSRSHGGWDSWGHHGVSPWLVAKAWYAAGCKAGPKFLAQIRLREIAQKGESTAAFVQRVRGARWARRAADALGQYNWPLSAKACRALGRISPELRSAALEGVPPTGSRVRIRDLNWEAVKARQEVLRVGGPRVRAALAGTRHAAALLGVEPDALASALAPAYPGLPVHIARRVALGEPPRQIAGATLTRREAHEWLTAGAPADIGGWLAERLELPAHRSPRVVRWLQNCRETGRWEAVTRERIARIPGDPAARVYSLLSVLDEVQDEDIRTGRDSVDAVLQRTAERLSASWLGEQLKNHRVLCTMPEWANRLPRSMRLLVTPAQLALEGQEMNHCVGGYVFAVERGQSLILAIRSRHGRSTVELRADLSVAQHYGPANGQPPKRHQQLVRAFIARLFRPRRAAA